jgi:hypothetical protein
MNIDTWPYWFELAVLFFATSIGNILLGHFERSKAKRVAKVILAGALVVGISATLGRGWSLGFCGVMGVVLLVIHGWWLPKQGINGWTAEPKDKYYALRGWKQPSSSS